VSARETEGLRRRLVPRGGGVAVRAKSSGRRLFDLAHEFFGKQDEAGAA